jgi:hypothetical protein
MNKVALRKLAAPIIAAAKAAGSGTVSEGVFTGLMLGELRDLVALMYAGRKDPDDNYDLTRKETVGDWSKEKCIQKLTEKTGTALLKYLGEALM